jgi:hypothetical protein
MPRIRLGNGATRFVDFLNPGDENASGAPSALDAGGIEAGQDRTQISTVQVVPGLQGQDENSLGPSASLPLMRRVTAPKTSVSLPRMRNTTRF